MPRRQGELVGHAECPVCDNVNADVRRDRRNHVYLSCSCCKPPTLIFTQGYPTKTRRILARTRLTSLVAA